MYKSMREWNSLGYRVMKGSKSHKRCAGVILFSQDQVYSIRNDPDEYEYEGSMEESLGNPDWYQD
jgi:hypothetical protein